MNPVPIGVPPAVPDGSSPPPALVREQLERILASAFFRHSQRRTDLLRWLVERVLKGESSPVKEYAIGIEVFARPESWDPRIDPIVRVEFSRVRQKLREFYAAEGSSAPVIVDFPARGYTPVFLARQEPGPARPPSGAPRPLSIRGAAALAGVVLLVAGFVAWRRAPFLHAKPAAIAVLPFADLSRNHQDEYLSDGITDELTNQLVMLPGMSVVARTSAFQFKGKSGDVGYIGRELHAGYVVEGGVERSGDAIRITARLESTSDGTQLWAQTYDSGSADILKLQSEIARSIAAALRANIAARSAPARPTYDPSPEAYDLYLRAMYAAQQAAPAGAREAADLLERVIQIEPQFAAAYWQLGTVYASSANTRGKQQPEQMRRAKVLLERAVALNPRLPGAYSWLAFIDYTLDWDWPRAQTEFQKALDLAPTAIGLETYAIALTTRGRLAEARECLRRAQLSDPLNPGLSYNYALVLSRQREYVEAEGLIQRCLSRNPAYFPCVVVEAANFVEERKPRETLQASAKCADLAPGSDICTFAAAMAHVQLGEREKALALNRQLTAPGANPGCPRFAIAVLQYVLGDTDRCFAYLEESAALREQQILNLKTEPFLFPLQKDPRMIALERRAGL